MKKLILILFLPFTCFSQTLNTQYTQGKQRVSDSIGYYPTLAGHYIDKITTAGCWWNLWDFTINVYDSLNVTKENTSNKATSFSVINNVFFPTTAAVNTFTNLALSPFWDSTKIKSELPSGTNSYIPFFKGSSLGQDNNIRYDTQLSQMNITNDTGGVLAFVSGYGGNGYVGSQNPSTSSYIEFNVSSDGVTNQIEAQNISGGTWTISGNDILSNPQFKLPNKSTETYTIATTSDITGGTVTRDSAGYGILGGIITTSGYRAVDTSLLATRLRLQKIVDSLSSIISTKGTVTSLGTSSPLTGGTITSIGTIGITQSDNTHDGYLSGADFQTFNNKQSPGNYITALTGDATAAGPNSAALTLATVNSNVGTFGGVGKYAQVTANTKGLITGISEGTQTISYTNLIGTVPTWNQNTTGSANYSTSVTVTDNSTNSTFFPTFVTTDGTSTSLYTKSSTLTYNPSTGNLTNTKFTGTTFNVNTPTSTGGQVNLNGLLLAVSNSATPLTLTNCLADFEGSVNDFVQINVRNASSGAAASGDIVVTGDNGDNSNHYVNLGKNSSGWATGTWTINGAGDSYLYEQTDNLAIGTAANKKLAFFTGGTLASNERMSISGSGVVSLGISTGVTGALALNGTTSGAVTMKGPDAPTSYTWIPPSSIAASTGMAMVVSSISGGTVTMTFATAGGSGGVTSVGVAVPTDLTVSGSPVTSSGTITLAHSTLNTITDGANFVYSGANGSTQVITLGAARTFTITNLLQGVRYVFKVIQDGTGSRVLTWPSVKVAYGGSGTPPISTSANAVDIYFFTYDGTTIYVDYALNYN